MRKIIIISISTLLALIALLVIAVILLTTLVNPNNYKPLIIDAVYQNSGRVLKLNGDLSWQLWPNIGLSLADASLSNPPGFATANFATLKQATVSVQLMPLLHKSVIIDKISLNGLNLNLITDGKNNNWSFTHPDKSHADKTEDKSKELKLKLKTFNLANSSISYINTRDKTKRALKDFGFNLHSPDEAISFNQDSQRLVLKQTEFNLDNIVKGVADINADFNNLSYKGSLDLQRLSLNKLLDRLSLPPINIANKTLLDQISLKTKLNGTKTSLTLSNIDAKMADTKLTGNINVNSFTPLRIAQDVNINGLNLDDLFAANGFKLPTQNIHASGNLSMRDDGIAGLNAKQDIHIDKLKLIGLNLNNLIQGLDKVLAKFSEMVGKLKLSNAAPIIDTIKEMQNIVDNAKKPGKKDYSQTTDLGSIDLNLLVNNGVAYPVNLKLNAATIKTNGNGNINLRQKTINYTTMTKLAATRKDSFLNELVFPYTMSGKLSDPNGSLDWASIQKQLLQHLVDNHSKRLNSLIKDNVTNSVNNVIDKQVPQNSAIVKEGVSKAINQLFK